MWLFVSILASWGLSEGCFSVLRWSMDLILGFEGTTWTSFEEPDLFKDLILYPEAPRERHFGVQSDLRLSTASHVVS